MPFNESSYEQTGIMRDALEMVVRLTRDGEHRRDEIAKIIVRIASEMTFDSTALANLTWAEMAEVDRKKGLMSGYAVTLQQKHAVLGLSSPTS